MRRPSRALRGTSAPGSKIPVRPRMQGWPGVPICQMFLLHACWDHAGVVAASDQRQLLARATPDLIYDQMVAAGCARKVIFSYMGNPGVGSLRMVRSAIERWALDDWMKWGVPEATVKKMNAARNLARTTSQSLRGRVISTSNVPTFFSSARSLMLIAGTKNR